MKHFDRQLTDILDEKLKYPLKSDGNILIGGCDNVMRMKILSVVRKHIRKLIKNAGMSCFEVQAKANRHTLDFLKRFEDESFSLKFKKRRQYLLVILDEMYGFSYSPISRDFELVLQKIADKDFVTILAATKYVSADVITPVVQKTFEIRISSKLSSDLCSRIMFRKRDAVLIAPDEVMVKDNEDVLACRFTSNTEPYVRFLSSNERIIQTAERILKEHMTAFIEMAK